MKPCLQCGRRNVPYSSFCSGCGAPLAQLAGVAPQPSQFTQLVQYVVEHKKGTIAVLIVL